MPDASVHLIHLCGSIQVPLIKQITAVRLRPGHTPQWDSAPSDHVWAGESRDIVAGGGVTNAQNRGNRTLPFRARFTGEKCASKGFSLKTDSTKLYSSPEI